MWAQGDLDKTLGGWVRLIPVLECASARGLVHQCLLGLLHWITFLVLADTGHNCFPASCNFYLAHSTAASSLEMYDSRLVFPLLLRIFRFLFLFWGSSSHHMDCSLTQALYEHLVMIQWSLQAVEFCYFLLLLPFKNGNICRSRGNEGTFIIKVLGSSFAPVLVSDWQYDFIIGCTENSNFR